MTSRKDIVDGVGADMQKNGLVYTKRGGWIDLGHARPGASTKLWNQLQNETASQFPGRFVVTFFESATRWRFTMSAGGVFHVKQGLPKERKEQIALGIFMQVSDEFEAAQNRFPDFISDSGYSGEDLVSDLVSFYRAVRPGRSYVELLQPVSQAESFAIWDHYGAVGKHKNKSFTPLLFDWPANGRKLPRRGALPDELNVISPAAIPVNDTEADAFRLDPTAFIRA